MRPSTARFSLTKPSTARCEDCLAEAPCPKASRLVIPRGRSPRTRRSRNSERCSSPRLTATTNSCPGSPDTFLSGCVLPWTTVRTPPTSPAISFTPARATNRPSTTWPLPCCGLSARLAACGESTGTPRRTPGRTAAGWTASPPTWRARNGPSTSSQACGIAPPRPPTRTNP